MPNINFPSGPTGGDTYTFNGSQWTFNGVAWVLNGTIGPQGASGSIGGLGNINYIPKFTPDGTTLGDSNISDDGSKVIISITTKLPFIEYAQNNAFAGEIVYFGSGTTVIGNVYYLDGANWALTDATLESKSKYLIGVAIGTNPTVDGMLIRGFAQISSVGGYSNGEILYLSNTTTGDVINVAPTTSTEVVRIVGYVVDNTQNQLYFCPDTTWITLA